MCLGLRSELIVPFTQVLKLPDGSKVEVFGPESKINPHFTTGPVAGFLVDDVHAAANELWTYGVEILLEEKDEHDNAWVHFRAPDGNIYELTYDPGVSRPKVKLALAKSQGDLIGWIIHPIDCGQCHHGRIRCNAGPSMSPRRGNGSSMPLPSCSATEELSATTMNEVARQAGVSPTTVTNHFPTHESLMEAVVARVVADIQVPNSTIFTGTRSLTGRLGVLTTAMFAFFERTMRWFELLGAELIEVPALARAEAAFWDSIRRLYEQALADSNEDLLAKDRCWAAASSDFWCP